MFQPLERQAKPAYERPLDLPSSSDTLKNEEEYASEQADARAVLDQKPILNFDSGMGELESDGSDAGGSADVGSEDLRDRLERGTME